MMEPTLIGRMRAARGMLDNAIDHYERAGQPCTPGQRRTRSDQAASAIARCLMLLGEAAYLVALEVLNEPGRPS